MDRAARSDEQSVDETTASPWARAWISSSWISIQQIDNKALTETYTVTNLMNPQIASFLDISKSKYWIKILKIIK